MIVMLTLAKCPPGLKGDITKWFQEIGTGVFVGNTSARVRDQLWKRVCEQCGSGEAIMSFSASNEQGFSFYVHNTTWIPVDYDGIVLLKKALPANTSAHKTGNDGSHFEQKKANVRRRNEQLKPVDISADILNNDVEIPRTFVAIDLETTGLRSKEDSIIEMAAVRYEQGKRLDQFHTLIKGVRNIPEEVISMTGITDELLDRHGEDLEDALEKVLLLIGDSVLVGHHAIFDIRFLREACRLKNMQIKQYQYIDTVYLAKALCDEEVENYRLETLVKEYSIADRQTHRALPDAILAAELYLKLIEKTKMLRSDFPFLWDFLVFSPRKRG